MSACQAGSLSKRLVSWQLLVLLLHVCKLWMMAFTAGGAAVVTMLFVVELQTCMA
jgi:hypothetical protein